MTATTAAIDAFLALLTEKAEGRYAYSVEMGRTNAKIVMAPIYNGQPHEMGRSIYCFIRLADGAILKAASWKAPAKGVRAWLADVLANPSPVHYSTGWLYRFT